jgi:hypothetical protein
MGKNFFRKLSKKLLHYPLWSVGAFPPQQAHIAPSSARKVFIFCCYKVLEKASER